MKHRATTADPPPGLDELVRRCAVGDRLAFTQLYDTSAAAIHLRVLELVGDRVLAETVTREVFAEVYRESHSLEAGMGAMAWMGGIARRRALAHSRGGVQPAAGERYGLARLALFGRLTHSQLEVLLDLPAGSASARIRRELMNLRAAGIATLPQPAG